MRSRVCLPWPRLAKREVGPCYLLGPLAGAAAFALAACSSESPSQGNFPATPLASMASTDGKLHIDIRTAPNQPLTAGLDSVELTITDPTTGAPVDGLSIAITPWMPSMGHGSSVVPQLQSSGGGRYVFTDVSLFMPGEWQLRTQFSGEVTDSVAPVFSVP